MKLVSTLALLAGTLLSTSAFAGWLRVDGQPAIYYAGSGYYCQAISEEQLSSYGLHWTQVGTISQSARSTPSGG